MAYSKIEIEKTFTIICDRIEGGESLRSVLRDDKMPSSQTFFKWIDGDEIKSKQLKASLAAKSNINLGLSNPRLNCARESNKKRFPNSQLYIINIANTEYYKVGVSQNPTRRICDIKNSMPFDIDIIYCEYHQNTYDLEENIHNSIADYYIKHEWFLLSDVIIVDVLNKIKDGKTYCVE